MMKLYLTTLACCLVQLFVAAQSKVIDPRCEPRDWKWRQLGGHLKISYDGERLRFLLLARSPDTSSFVRSFLKDKNDKDYFSLNMGKMKIGKEEVPINSSSDYISYEVHDHIVHFTVYAHDIPCVVNEKQAFDILMVNFSPDSALFECTGKEYIKKVLPDPGVFTHKQATWLATVADRNKRHSEFAVVLTGSDKGAFGFSMLSLRELNRSVPRAWESVTWELVTLSSFWFLWYLLLAGRCHFEKIDANMVRRVVKWLPWLAGFYFVLMLDDVVAGCSAEATWKWRGGFAATAVLLLFSPFFWRKCRVIPGVLLINNLCRTLAYSILIFVLLGAGIQVADHFWGDKNPFSGIGGFLRLEVSARYAVWAIVVCYLYIAFVFFKLFAFNRIMQVIAIGLTIITAPWEPYRVLSEGGTQEFDCGIEFQYPIKRLGETDIGSLDLRLSFLNQSSLFFYIPFLLAVYLMALVARRNDQQKMTVLMLPFFAVFYCCYLTNIHDTFLLLPFTLLCAMMLTQELIPGNTRTRLRLIDTANQIYTQELTDMNIFRKMPELRQSVKLKEVYRQKMLSGEMLPADYEKAITDLDKLIGERDAKNISRRMAFGPFREAFRNGLLGLGYGALVSGIIYMIYFKYYLVEPHYKVYGIPFLLSGKTSSMIIQHLAPVVFHSVAGFCLGYFFTFLEGKSGWEKGAWLGMAIGTAHTPMMIFSGEYTGWEAIGGIFFKHVIVLVLTGFLAFDLVTIRRIYGRQHSWKEVVDVMGWKKTLVFGSLVLTAVGAGITSWISGSVAEVLKSWLG